MTNGLEALLGQPVRLVWAGRTDSGVHADGNVCALDVARLDLPLERLCAVLNTRLPADLRTREAQLVAPDWHPRFDARAREYVYRVWRGDEAPYDKLRFAAPYAGQWDEAAVAATRGLLVGTHDFRAFTKDAAKLKSTSCDLFSLEQVASDGEIRWMIRGNRFLRHMVCNLAGTLLAVAAGRIGPPDVRRALDEEQSFKLRPAPPLGLALMQVIYPPAAPGAAE